LFIKRVRLLGFEVPYSGTKHQFMVFGQFRLTIPSNKEYSIPQLKMLINEIELMIDHSITAQEWNDL